MTKQNSRSQSGDDKERISNEEIVDFFFKKCKRIKKLSQNLSNRGKIFLGICKTKLAELFSKFEENQSEIEENYSPCLCPDQYVGQLKCQPEKTKKEEDNFIKRIDIFESDTVNLTARFKEILESPKIRSPFMILILESPHKNEFDKDGKPIGPARGTTGDNIVSPLRNVFFTYTESRREHHLILMNAIPFQCSLGVSSGTFRDEVFAKSWEEEEKKFEERLDSLLKALNGKTVVIVNACTQEKVGKKKRRQNVTESIKKVIRTYKSVKELWEAPHPSSSWWFVEKCWKEIPIER